MKLSRNSRSCAPVLLGVAVAAAVLLAACGSSSKATVSPGAQPSATTPTTVAAPSTTASGTATPAVVKTATTAKGSILVDSSGKTLYTLTNGAGVAVACTGQCATFWPPLLLSSSAPKAVGAAGVTGLGSTSGETGNQVTDNGLPLYRFSMDKAPGQTNGDGLSSFGGTWHVVAASGQTNSATSTPPATTPAATTPTTAASSGYGY